MNNYQPQRLIRTSIRFNEGVIAYLEKEHGKNAHHFVRVAVDKAIAQEKEKKG